MSKEQKEEYIDELLNLNEIVWRYDLSHQELQELTKSQEFPGYYITQMYEKLYLNKEILAFLKKNRKRIIKYGK
jgi:hypothetical protein